MGILLAFLPFLLFVIIERLLGVTAGLMSAAALSAALLVRGLMDRNKTVKVLEVGTVFLFGVLAAYSSLVTVTWAIAGVRLCLDAGLLGVVLVSIAIRRPFTLQYAREQVAPDLWDRPEFVRANYVITAVWAFAFMAASDLASLYTPRLPTYVGITTTAVAMVGAARFTSWYPARRRPK